MPGEAGCCYYTRFARGVHLSPLCPLLCLTCWRSWWEAGRREELHMGCFIAFIQWRYEVYYRCWYNSSVLTVVRSTYYYCCTVRPKPTVTLAQRAAKGRVDVVAVGGECYTRHVGNKARAELHNIILFRGMPRALP